MPIHVQDMQSELSVHDEELPLSEEQLERLAVLLQRRQVERPRSDAERGVPRRTVVPQLEVRG